MQAGKILPPIAPKSVFASSHSWALFEFYLQDTGNHPQSCWDNLGINIIAPSGHKLPKFTDWRLH